MTRRKLDTWAWIMIYGGMLGLSLGWFMLARDTLLGIASMIVGTLVTTVGAGLIFVRSRMGP
jgi:hypothetical protein